MSNEKIEKKVKVLAYFTPTQMQKIEDYQFNNRLQSRNEAIRELVDLGLKSAK